MARRNALLIVVTTLLILIAVSPSETTAARTGPNRTIAPSAQVFTIDEFTYRVSFRLSDGVEVLLLRGSFELLYYYQHHHPTVSKHHISAVFGFYYAKSALGRTLIRSAEVDRVAFYPMWSSFSGHTYDWVDTGPALQLNDTLVDGQMIGTRPMITNKPLSRYLPSFGGIFVFEGLTIKLRDGTSIRVGEDPIRIALEKESSKMDPRGSIEAMNANLSYESSVRLMTLTIPSGGVSGIITADMLTAVSLAGIGIVAATVFILQRTNRIHVSLDRIRSMLQQRQEEGEPES
ncbi:MAG: hypothetical protein GF309_15205 [Candidatus Lokiarchaeota archaeon]|nr:hypothetical protein [Candidatus Lokiarchaeota archaeon]